MEEDLWWFLWEFCWGKEQVKEEGSVLERRSEGTDDENSEEVESRFVSSNEDIRCTNEHSVSAEREEEVTEIIETYEVMNLLKRHVLS